VKLQVSVGIALYPNDTDRSIEKLIHNANLALSNAGVGNGGSRMRFFDPDLARLAEEKHRLENDLRWAIRDHQLILFFQPIVDLDQGRLVGAEALIRWQHPQRGLIPPDAFIPLAEEAGLIGDMGLWVLESAGRQLAAWRREGRELYLSVNVSARQIPDELPPGLLLDLANRLGFAPTSLALEITEGVLISDVGGVQAWLDAVRAIGFPVYLDDFGTGYASLSYLKRFSVDRLKVDRSFVRDIATNQGDHALVEAMTAMARSFGMEVIAEGVEDRYHIRLLSAMGCRYAQGYLFSPPVPIASFHEASEHIPALFESLVTAQPAIHE
jgi:EAL domain-containing protein (putative c-di-GMP-specific phosphodiesterase class I)